MPKRQLREMVKDGDARDVIDGSLVVERDHSIGNRDQKILRRLHRNIQVDEQQNFDKFRAKRFDFSFQNLNDPIDLSANMREDYSNAFSYMELFFKAIFEKMEDMGGLPQDVVHLYMQTGGNGNLFSMDYAGRDRMTLGGLLAPQTNMLDKMLENFALIIQSDVPVVLDSQTKIRAFLFRPPN